MTTINDTYINALLADSAYVDNLLPGMTGADLADRIAGRMTPTLAEYIGDNFSVVNQVSGLASSFDATVWRGNAGTPYAGQVYVSMRGTQEAPDFLADGDLATSGLAHQQLADMVNWWLRETTPAITDAGTPKYATQITVAPNGDFALASPRLGTGGLVGIGAIKSVNGHSLGGYLASSFVRLFGKQWPVEAINTFNSAGFSRIAATNIENGFNQVAQAIGSALGLGAFSDAQNNFYAKNGINVTTNTWDPVGFRQYGTRLGLFQEDLTPGIINNHYMYKLTDLLALGNALEQLDPKMDWAKLSALVSAGSNQMVSSYEEVLDGLRRMLLGANVPLTLSGDANASNTGPQPDARLDYHTKLANLKNSAYFQALKGRVQVVALPSDGLAAKTDFGAVLALKYGLPFELKGTGLDAIWQQAQPDLYAKWQQDRGLSAADQAAGKANFTNQWLIDRANYVQALRAANTAKNNSANSFDGDTWIVTDQTTGRTLTLMPVGASGTDPLGNSTGGTNNSAQIDQLIFGGDGSITGGTGVNHLYAGSGNDTLDGSAGKSDYLQGGAGNDSLIGGTGADTLCAGSGNATLVGGKGDDLLYGGSGTDTYQFTTGDGKDTLINGNAQSTIVIDGTTLSGGKQVFAGGKLWQSADGKIIYTLVPTSNGHNDLEISYGSSDLITVKDYTPGMLGIALQDGPPLTTPADPVITNPGPILGKLVNTTVNGVPFSYTEYREGVDGATNVNANNAVTTDNGANDIALGNGNNSIVGGSGNDTIYAGGGSNIISGGGGQDYITINGAGGNVINANGGRDIIYGGNGANRIYADKETDVASALGQLQQATASSTRGNFITVGAGNNTLVGGTGNDVMLLGGGNNLVVAGPGSDTIFGGAYGGGLIAPDWTSKNTVAANGNTIVNFTGAQILTSGGYAAPASYQGNLDDYGNPLGGGNDTVLGGKGNHVIALSNGNNYVDLGSGNSTASGGMGNDTIFGGSGNVYINGGGGDDYIVAGSGNDTIYGGSGNNTILGGSGKSTLYANNGGAGSATLNQGNNYVEAGSGDTLIRGSGGNDTLVGGIGNDTLVAGVGNTTLMGGSGVNHLAGGAGKNVIYAGDGGVAGNPTQVQAGSGDTTVYGGSGIDSILGGAGINLLYAGNGGTALAPTYVAAGKGSTTIQGGAGVDLIIGGDGDNVLYAGDGGTAAAPTTVKAGAGKTTIYGGGGVDYLWGGTNDNVIYAGDGGSADGFTQVVAGTGNTTIYGGAGVDHLFGGAGKDLLYAGSGGTQDAPTHVIAGSGDNTLVAGSGYSVLSGGGGNATYEVAAGSGNVSIIQSAATDKLRFGAGITQISLTATTTQATNGSKLVTLQAGLAAVTIQSGASGTMLNQVSFADGTSLSLSHLLAQSVGGSTTVINPDGSYRVTTSDGQGGLVMTQYSATDVKLGDGWIKADGSKGSDTFNADGTASGKATYADGTSSAYVKNAQGQITTTYYATDGVTITGTSITALVQDKMLTIVFNAAGTKLSDSWTKADGSSGTDTFNADGSSTGTVLYADGTTARVVNDGKGNVTTTQFDKTGVKIGDTWTKANGSYGTDVFKPDGSSSGTVHNADGTYSVYTNDGHGSIVTVYYDAHGNVISGTPAGGGTPTVPSGGAQTSDGHGGVITTFYSPAGVKLLDTWTKADGSHGVDVFGVNGLNSGSAYQADGSYSIYTQDAPGSTTTKYYTWDGTLTGSASALAQGPGSITYTFDATGKLLKGVVVNADGSTSSVSGMPPDPLLYFQSANFSTNPQFSVLAPGGNPSVMGGAGNQFGTEYASLDFDYDFVNRKNSEVNISETNAPDYFGPGQGYKASQFNMNDATTNVNVWGTTDPYYGGAGTKVLEIDPAPGSNGATSPVQKIVPVNSPAMLTLPAGGPVGDVATGYATFTDDGRSDLVMRSYTTSGVLENDKWMYANGSVGWDTYNANGSRSGWALSPSGQLIKYTDDGHGHVTTTSATPLPPTLPKPYTPPTTNPPQIGSPPGIGGGSPTGSQTGSGAPLFKTVSDGKGGTYTLMLGQNGYEIIAHTWASGLVTYGSVKTDPGYGAAVTVGGTKYGWTYDVSGLLDTRYSDDGKGRVVTYNYASQGLGAGSNVAVTQADGSARIDHFDMAGRATGYSLQSASSNGRVETHDFDTAGHATGSHVMVTDSHGNGITSNYDASGALLSFSTDVKADSGALTSTTYDAAGHPSGAFVTTTASDGTIHTANYDGAGRLTGSVVATTDAAGNVTTANYDASNVLTSYVTVSSDPTTGTLVAVFDGQGIKQRDNLVRADGTLVSTSYGAGGARAVTTRGLDGSYAVLSDDGHGWAVTTSYSAQDLKLSDVWTRADGTSGRDTFNADGSSTGSISFTDGSIATVASDGHGKTTTSHYAKDGSLTGTSITTASQGSSTTTNYGPGGAQISTAWTLADGTHGASGFGAANPDPNSGPAPAPAPTPAPPAPPVLSVANPVAAQTTSEDKLFSFTVPATTFASSAAGDVLTLSATLANGNSLPTWLTFDPKTSTFGGTPDDPDVGTVSVKLVAVDAAGATVSTSFNLTVNGVPPTVAHALADQTTNEDQLFTYTVPANTFADGDPKDPLVLSATLANNAALPAWLKFDPNAGTFSGTPDDPDVGAIIVKVTATDPLGLTASTGFKLTVNAVPPVLAHPIPDQTAIKNTPFTLAAGSAFADSDPADALRYSATLADGSPLPKWLSFDAVTGQLSGKAGATDLGNFSIKVTATDGLGLTVSDTFPLTVIKGIVVTGGSGNQVLTGSGGDDTLIAGSGIDTMIGGQGDDTYMVNNSQDVIVELPGEGNDTVLSSVSCTLPVNVENLVGTGSANLVLKGSSTPATLTANAGIDTLIGGSGRDTFVVNNASDVVQAQAGGINTVQTSVSWTAGANIQDLIGLGSADLLLTGNKLNDYIVGNSGNDTLIGMSDLDILQGGSGNDLLRAHDGAAALLGGGGNDTIEAGKGNDFIAGGKGNDLISTGAAHNVVAINAGDGQDTVSALPHAVNTLSLGGGIAYADLSFTVSGHDLVLKTGKNDAITFKNWYSGSNHQNFVTLQVIEQAATGYDAKSRDPLVNKKIETFDFANLVSQFDAARAAHPGLSSWGLMNGLLGAHLSSSDTEALGGDLAYYYGTQGSLSGMDIAAVQGTLTSSKFGTATQKIDAWRDISQSGNRIQ